MLLESRECVVDGERGGSEALGVGGAVNVDVDAVIVSASSSSVSSAGYAGVEFEDCEMLTFVVLGFVGGYCVPRSKPGGDRRKHSSSVGSPPIEGLGILVCRLGSVNSVLVGEGEGVWMPMVFPQRHWDG